MKKIIKIIIPIIILGIITALIVNYVLNIKEAQKEMNKNSEIIKNNYEKFTSSIEPYNKIRTDYITISSNFYYDTYKQKHEEYINILTKYNEIITEIDTAVDYIASRCDVIYKDSKTNSICSNYQKTYEKLINLYINDLSDYNNKITKYNEYKADTEETVSKFLMIHQEYIDYNHDKIYEGKDNKGEN